MSAEAVSAENNSLDQTDAQLTACPPLEDAVANMKTEVR